MPWRLSWRSRTRNSFARTICALNAGRLMATFSHWTMAGPTGEEYLFWDNGELMKDIGPGT
jgi:hypothetical protein